MIARLNINADGGEQLTYNAPDFPVRCVDGDLSRFHDYAAGCHWHNDFEILFANEGDMDYFVNGQVVTIKQGQAIFVNSNRLHYGFSRAKTECFYNCLLFHPDIFGAAAKTVEPMTRDQQPDYLLLTGEAVLEPIHQIFRLYETKPRWLEMEVLEALCRLTRRLRQQMEGKPETPADGSWLALRQMVGYLQTNYQKPIRLEDIAASGAVCRSKCCRLFRENLQTTPMGYLNRYRLEKARELLLTTRRTVTDIAGECGFEGPSYFSEMFRKIYGESPREMRTKQ